MAQGGQQLGLMLKLALGLRAGIEVLLNGHRYLQRQIPGAVHGPKPALTNELDDSVAIGQDVADVERHRYPLLVCIAGTSAVGTMPYDSNSGRE